MKKVYPLFKKFFIGTIIIFCFGVFLLYRSTKNKDDFKKASGKITYLAQKLGNHPKRNIGKHRFIVIDTYHQAFELFVGKESTDFKPEFERIDELEMSDEIDIYFDEENSPDGINRLVQFIDKNNEAYFIRGNMDRNFGIFFLVIGIISAGITYYLKKDGQIE